MDEEIDTSFTHKCTSVETRICILAATFRNQPDNQQIAISVGMCPLSNQLIPLPLNDDTAVSGRNEVSVSDSELPEVLGVSDVATKQRAVWLQMCCKKRHKSLFLVPKIGENPTAGFSISICSTHIQNHPTPLRTDMFQVTGNIHVAVVI